MDCHCRSREAKACLFHPQTSQALAVPSPPGVGMGQVSPGTTRGPAHPRCFIPPSSSHSTLAVAALPRLGMGKPLDGNVTCSPATAGGLGVLPGWGLWGCHPLALTRQCKENELPSNHSNSGPLVSPVAANWLQWGKMSRHWTEG